MSKDLYLRFLSFQFWQGISLDELRKTQHCPAFNDSQDFTADFWPPEDSIENFLDFLQKQCQDTTLN